MAKTAWMSLHDWNLIGDHHFIGLENYRNLIKDPYFWKALRNTLALFVIATVPQLLLALWLADMLNRNLRARTFWRIAIVVPNVTSVAAVAVVFGFGIFAKSYGVADWLLGFVGVHDLDWRDGPTWASWLAISAMVDWRWTGYNALIFLAAMQAIPRDLYESAAIDGAGRARQLWQITLPMLRPTLFFVVIVSTIGGMQLFTEPWLFSGTSAMTGGAIGQYQTLAMLMFDRGINNVRTAGYGAAIAWTLFLIIILMSLLNYAVIRRSLKSAK
jgi:cellobiose transport system permease protein